MVQGTFPSNSTLSAKPELPLAPQKPFLRGAAAKYSASYALGDTFFQGLQNYVRWLGEDCSQDTISACASKLGITALSTAIPSFLITTRSITYLVDHPDQFFKVVNYFDSFNLAVQKLILKIPRIFSTRVLSKEL